MKLSTKIAYNTIIQIFSKTVATALGLVTIAIITRFLGQNGYGQYTTIFTFLSFFGIMADFGLTLVTVQMISQPGVDEEKTMGNLFTLRLISALIFLGLAPVVILFFPYDHEIKTGVFIASFSFLFTALNQVMVGLFQKKLRMDKVSIAEITNRIILVATTIIFINLNYGLKGILYAMVISNCLNFLILYYFSHSYLKLKLYFDFSYWKKIISLSWPLAVTITLNLIYLRTDTLLLSIIKRHSDIGIIAEVGLYGAAYKVIDVLITLPFMFAGIILPIMTMRWAEKDRDGFKNILQKAFDVMAICAWPLVLGTLITASNIMVFIAGKEFAASGPILTILITASGVIFLGCMFSHAIIAIGKQKKIISSYFFVATTSLVGYFIFIPLYSYYGAAWVTVYSEVTIALASFYLVYKYTRFLPSLNIFFKAMLASVLMAFVVYLVQLNITTNLFFILPLAGIVYFIVLYLFKGLSREEILNIIKPYQT
jgi:O-antigen/teichoic acid export membrane protein